MNVRPTIQRIRPGSSHRGEPPRRARPTSCHWTKCASRRFLLVLSVLFVLEQGRIIHAQEWTSLGLEEKEIKAIAVRDGAVYVGTDNGVYRRDLRSELEWTPLGFEGETITVLHLDATSPLIAYAGVEVASFPAEPEPSLFRTVDGGSTWTPVGAGFEGRNVVAIVQVFDPEPALLVAPSFGVFRSEDRGNEWIALGVDSSLPINNKTFVVAPMSPEHLFLGGSNGLQHPKLSRSQDAGKTWGTSFLASQPGAVHEITLDPTNSRLYYLWFGGFTISKTTNDGRSYEVLEPPAFPAELLIDPEDSNRLIAGGGGISRSLDGGLTWTLILLPENVSFRTMTWDESDTTTVYVGAHAGVYLLELPPPPAAARDRSWVEYE